MEFTDEEVTVLCKALNKFAKTAVFASDEATANALRNRLIVERQERAASRNINEVTQYGNED